MNLLPCIFSERENWAVITRHPAIRSVPILDDSHQSPNTSPVLAFATNIPGGIATGHIMLDDDSNSEDLTLHSGYF